MRKLAFIIFTAILLFGSPSVHLFSQTHETEQTEQNKLSKREQRKLKRQQKKEEEKLQVEEEKEEGTIINDEKSTQPHDNKEYSVQQEYVNEENKSTENDSTQIEQDPETYTEKNKRDKLNEENNSHSYQNQGNKTEQESTKSRPLTSKEKTTIWFIIVGIILLLNTRYRYKRKCDGCKKWNAMKKIGTECIDEKPTVIIEKREMKNSKGEVIRSWDESVPATTYYYRTHRKCKYCGYKDYLSSSEKQKN